MSKTNVMIEFFGIDRDAFGIAEKMYNDLKHSTDYKESNIVLSVDTASETVTLSVDCNGELTALNNLQNCCTGLINQIALTNIGCGTCAEFKSKTAKACVSCDRYTSINGKDFKFTNWRPKGEL